MCSTRQVYLRPVPPAWFLGDAFFPISPKPCGNRDWLQTGYRSQPAVAAAFHSPGNVELMIFVNSHSALAWQSYLLELKFRPAGETRTVGGLRAAHRTEPPRALRASEVQLRLITDALPACTLSRRRPGMRASSGRAGRARTRSLKPRLNPMLAVQLHRLRITIVSPLKYLLRQGYGA